jgi:hypothetical protein
MVRGLDQLAVDAHMLPSPDDRGVNPSKSKLLGAVALPKIRVAELNHPLD